MRTNILLRLAGAAAALLLLGGAPPVAAGDGGDEPRATADRADTAKSRARLHHDRAATHYKLGRFERALGHYERAYELYPVPPLLFNIGQCHRQLGRHERAVFFFEGYLREHPEARNRALVLELIDEEREKAAAAARHARLDQQRDRQRAAGSAPDRRLQLRVDQAARQVIAERPALVEGLSRPGTAPTGEDRSSGRRWWVWAAAGTAAALAGGALYLHGSGGAPVPGLGVLDRR